MLDASKSITVLGVTVPSQEETGLSIEGDCIVGITEPTTGISLFGAVGIEAADGDGVAGIAVSRMGLSLVVGTDPDDGDCVMGTPETAIGVLVVVSNGIEPADGEAVVGIPEVLTGSTVSLTVGTTKPNEGA